VEFALEIRHIRTLQIFREMKAGEGKKNLVYECDWRRRPFNIEENAAHHRVSVSGDVAPAEAYRFEPAIHTAFAIFGCPSCRVQKKADAANLFVTAQIKPVQRPARDTDQIARFDFNSDDRRGLGVNVENSSALNDKTNLIFGVDMFSAELREH